MKKISESSSGVFTVKEYLPDEKPDFIVLVRRLNRGAGKVQEVVSYVFEGEDPLGVDAKSFSAEEFEKKYPEMIGCGYGQGLAFDVIVRTEGHPVTVELTEGSPVIAVNSLDKDAELEDLLGDDNEEEMSPEAFLKILSVAEKLKCVTRHCDTSSGRRESVAEHSWRIALMAMLLSGQREFADIDMNRVIRMCLIHDLGEVFTGDIPTFQKTKADENEELGQLESWISTFPAAQRREFEELFAQMEERKTREARLFKALDKLEAIIQHNESDISSWLPLEYDLQLTYGKEESSFFPYLEALRDRIDLWTKQKIEEAADQS